MKTIYEKTILCSTGIIKQTETYKIIKDKKEIKHKYKTVNEYGENKQATLLTVARTNEKISEHKCHLCDLPATHKISIGNISEYYCNYHRAVVLQRLILYKAALKYWYEEVKYAKKDTENRRIWVE